MERLKELIAKGPYSETCAFWSPPNMDFKQSKLSKYLFSYGIIASFLNGTANVLGLAPVDLVNYYGKYGLLTDSRVPEIIDYSNQLHPSQFVLYNKNNDNEDMYKEIMKHMQEDSYLPLSPYQDTYLRIEKPVIAFTTSDINKQISEYNKKKLNSPSGF